MPAFRPLGRFVYVLCVALTCVMLITKTTHRLDLWWIGAVLFALIYLPTVVKFIASKLRGPQASDGGAGGDAQALR